MQWHWNLGGILGGMVSNFFIYILKIFMNLSFKKMYWILLYNYTYSLLVPSKTLASYYGLSVHSLLKVLFPCMSRLLKFCPLIDSSHNLPSYRACSQMLASISGYQYTRRSWRKEAFEMLMEAAFFQMDARSISYWHVVIDNLMTHDKTTFKDLMGMNRK